MEATETAAETAAEAAVREVEEETGLRGIGLLAPPAPVLPAGFPLGTHRLVVNPWWIIEQNVPVDNHLGEPHVHVDHQYLALVDEAVWEESWKAAHAFDWFTATEVAQLDMFDDCRVLAVELFEGIELIAGDWRTPGNLGGLLEPFRT